MNNQNLSNIANANTSIVGIVIIGRNESKRLSLCLQSTQSNDCPTIYVDSGSTDQSVKIAKPLVNIVHQLEPSKPFSAARARNEGFEQLCNLFPKVKLIQFIDGDCELIEGWLRTAEISMLANPKRAVVMGHLQERNPDYSVYNRLCAMEWKSAAGEVKNFGALGGIFMVRVNVFKALKGFNANVIAGEDSEFGVRLSLAGYLVTKIDFKMAIHDANMTTFSQWWIRAVRAGHAIGQRSHLNGKTAVKDCVRERKSTLFWGVFLPATALIMLIPTRGASILIMLFYFVLALKIYLSRRRQGESVKYSILYAKFIVMGKLANGLGLLKFYFNRFKKKYEIIEYK